MTIEYFLTDEGQFDYTEVINPTSQQQMYGYKAVGWNTDFSMTGWWQNMNVIALTTDSPLYDPDNGRLDSHSQAVQVQQTWAAGEKMPWLWTERGQDYTFTAETDMQVLGSWGDNLQQALMLTRFEDVSSGQRLWVQFRTFDNKYPDRPMDIFSDPHTGHQDIVVNIDVVPGTYSEFVSFDNSDTMQSDAYSGFMHFEANMSRQQFTNILLQVEESLGIDIQNESGYWSLIQAGVSPEMASGFPEWGIGDFGAMQIAVDSMAFWGA